MKKKILMLVLILLLASVSTACTGAIRTVEVTRIIPQTVIVTQIVQKTVTLIPKTPAPVELRTEPDQSTAYYEGIIILAQYYTLLDQGLYEHAFRLLSASRSNVKSLEEFLAGHKMINIYTYKLISAQPYYEWAEKQGLKPTLDSETKKQFYIRVYAEGEGGMAGSVTNGIHTYFATLVWEEGEWKIYSINTSPQ